MLFVDDDKTKLLERHVALDQRVRADDDAGAALGGAVALVVTLGPPPACGALFVLGAPLLAFLLSPWGLALLGLLVGSFLNVCIYRIPTKEGLWESLSAIIFPPSRCPRCQNRIPGWTR